MVRALSVLLLTTAHESTIYLKKNLNRNKKAHSDSGSPGCSLNPLITAEGPLKGISGLPISQTCSLLPIKGLTSCSPLLFHTQGLCTYHPICLATPCSLRSHSTITIHTLHSACTQQILNNCQQEELSLLPLFSDFPLF